MFGPPTNRRAKARQAALLEMAAQEGPEEEVMPVQPRARPARAIMRQVMMMDVDPEVAKEMLKQNIPINAWNTECDASKSSLERMTKFFEATRNATCNNKLTPAEQSALKKFIAKTNASSVNATSLLPVVKTCAEAEADLLAPQDQAVKFAWNQSFMSHLVPNPCNWRNMGIVGTCLNSPEADAWRDSDSTGNCICICSHHPLFHCRALLGLKYWCNNKSECINNRACV